MKRTYRAVLFDMDGTLIETRIDFQELRRRLHVPEGEGILDWIDTHKEPERSRLHAVLDEVEREAAASAALMPGARRTLDWLRDHRVPFGILTRNSLASWETVKERCGLHSVTDVFTRETGGLKPHPASVEPAISLWGIPAKEVVHVGDYLYDLQLARAVGMYSILIHPNGKNPFFTDCDFVATDHGCLLEHLRTLPMEGRIGTSMDFPPFSK